MKTMFLSFSILACSLTMSVCSLAFATTDFTAPIVAPMPGATSSALSGTGLPEGGELNLSSNVIVLDSEEDFENLRRQLDETMQGNVLELEAAPFDPDPPAEPVDDVFETASIQGSGGASVIPQGEYKLDMKPELIKWYRGFPIWLSHVRT